VGGRLCIWAIACALVAAPARAGALPVLRLFLDGDVERLGSGGAAAFRSDRSEALRLERPALLAGTERPAIRLALENEAIVSLHEGRYAGTEIHDRELRLTAIVPLRSAFDATLFVGVRRETARLHLHSAADGTLIDSTEGRDAIAVGFAKALPFGLRLGGSLGTSSAGEPAWLLEARWRASPLVEAWYRGRSDAARYDLRVPDGVARKVRSPEVRYRIDDLRSESELGAEIGTREVAWLRGAIVAEDGEERRFEAGFRPRAWLDLRVGSDREVYRFDDTMEATGTGAIARVDLGLRRTRWFGGFDARVGEGEIVGRYVHSELAGASRGEEVGTNAARAFLQVDYDMGLFFRGGYRLEGHQLALGWNEPAGEAVGWAVGAQVFRLIAFPADFTIRSDTLQRALAVEETRQARADLLGLTGALHVPIGAFRLSAAVGQFVPLSMQQAGGDAPRHPRPPRPPPRPAPPREAPGPYAWLTSAVGDALDALSKAGGGNRFLLEISTEL